MSVEMKEQKEQNKSTNSTQNTNSSGPSKQSVWKMFDRISHRYDLLNRLLSLRQDVVWRKRVVTFLPDTADLKVLDLATGTADVLLTILAEANNVKSAVGIDVAKEMLKIGRDKITRKNLNEIIQLIPGDASKIPFSDNKFDAITIAFGIRNVKEPHQALDEMCRVLKSAGRVIILEFSLPENVILRKLYLFYFRHILPSVGGLISGDSKAYRYLNKSVEDFPYGQKFCDKMAASGFQNTSCVPLTFGISSIYIAEKP